MNIQLSDQADQFMASIPRELACYLASVIRAKSQTPSLCMVVNGWTINLPDHIYRAIKDYRYKPGIRIIFHCEDKLPGFYIDRIAWRDQDPYQDGK